MYNYSDPITIKFSDELFFSLAAFGYISLNFETGIIWNNVTWRQMGYINNTGYVDIAWKYNGKTIHALAHRILWLCNNDFIPDGMQINHINGIKSDNRDINLELVTPSQNMRHAYMTGLACGTNVTSGRVNYFLNNLQYNAKLSPDQIRAIRQRHVIGGRCNSTRKLASEFGVSRWTIEGVIKNRYYRNII